LEKLDATGKVHVVQEAEKEGEKGLDVTGELLNLMQDVKGAIVTVYGDGRPSAAPKDVWSVLKFGETDLRGPKVTIDQIKNVADVDGQGMMEMPSKTSLDADRPARPDSRLTVHWNKSM